MKTFYTFLFLTIFLITSCSSDKESMQQTVKLDKPAPGVISLSGKITGYDGENYSVSVKVLEFISGGNTPPVKKGKNIEVFFSDRGELPSLFKAAHSNETIITIKIKAINTLGNQSPTTWQFLEFIK